MFLSIRVSNNIQLASEVLTPFLLSKPNFTMADGVVKAMQTNKFLAIPSKKCLVAMKTWLIRLRADLAVAGCSLLEAGGVHYIKGWKFRDESHQDW